MRLSQHTQQAIVLCAAVLSTAALAYVVVNQLKRSRPSQRWVHQSHLSDEVNDAYDRMLNVIKPKKRLTRDDVSYCLAHASGNVPANYQLAHTLLFEVVRDGQVGDDSEIRRVREHFLQSLANPIPEYRSSTIGFFAALGWLGDPEIRERVKVLFDDPHPVVAQRARTALGE